MKQPRISYVAARATWTSACRRRCTAAPARARRARRAAVRAHVPAAFWAFADPWKAMFHSGVCDHAIKELCRVYISRTVKCEFCGNQRSIKATTRASQEGQYDDLLNFENSDKYDDRQKAALAYAQAIAWDEHDRDGLLGPAARPLLRGRAGRARLRHRADLRPAELDPAARHRPPPVHGRHRRLDGAGLPDRRGAGRVEGQGGLLGQVARRRPEPTEHWRSRATAQRGVRGRLRSAADLSVTTATAMYLLSR